MTDAYIITREKLESLKKELEFLTTSRRREVANTLEYAKSLGDLSENAEYHEARAEQAELEGRIKQIEHILKNAQITEHKGSEEVEIGSTVTLKKKGATSTIVYHIVGSGESDILQGNISYRSPIGTALMGKKKGEIVTIQVPAGTVEYSIVSLS
jgi:transcription elongation factor GreA